MRTMTTERTSSTDGIDLAKFHGLQLEFELLANSRRSRYEVYRNRLAAWRALFADAISYADAEFQALRVDQLIDMTSDELAAGGVDEPTLRRAAVERQLALGVMRGDPGEDERFASLSALMDSLIEFVGEPQ